MPWLELSEVAAWALIAAGVVYALLERSHVTVAGATVGAALAALLVKAALLDMS